MASLSGQQTQLQTPSDATKAIQSAVPVAGDFSQVGSIRSITANTSAGVIDITNQSSLENREILDGRGIKMLDVSFETVGDDGQIFKDIETNLYANRHRWFRIVQVDNANRTFTAKFKIVSINKASSYDDAVTFSIELQSSGSVTIA